MSVKIEISIVIPIMNEEWNLIPLINELDTVLKKLNKTYQIIIINDGSTDNSGSILNQVTLNNPRLLVIHLKRNFGQTAAMSAGFDAAKGKIVIVMDGDLQNDPNDIARLIEKLGDDYDLVSGWRKNRKDKLISRKIPSKTANYMISKITGVKLHDYGCSLKAYRKSVLNHINLYGEMHRFIPALMEKVGAKIGEIPVGHRSRISGHSKYGISRTFRVILDLLLVKFQMQFATQPLHMIGLPGLLSTLTGISIGAYLTFQKFVFGLEFSQRPLLLFSILLVVIGFQFITMGLLAELLVRIYHESSGKLTYIIESKVENGETIEDPNH